MLAQKLDAMAFMARRWPQLNFRMKPKEKRPTVQVGDPFTGKLLMEACLELMAADAVLSIQDMGAAGLTSSSVEMASKGGLGMEIDLDLVPVREDAMSAYEIMLSESQERMLMVIKPEQAETARAIFEKWDLDFMVIGKVTDTQRLVLLKDNEIACDIPLAPLVDDAPEYDRPYRPEELQPVLGTAHLAKDISRQKSCNACYPVQTLPLGAGSTSNMTAM